MMHARTIYTTQYSILPWTQTQGCRQGTRLAVADRQVPRMLNAYADNAPALPGQKLRFESMNQKRSFENMI